MNFSGEMKQKVNEIEAILDEYLPAAEGYQKQIMEAMAYSVTAGGKRLRPMLMQETFRLFGGEGKVVEPFMAAADGGLRGASCGDVLLCTSVER